MRNDMRPVDKGASPIEGDFAEYQDAIPHLINRLGNYCSYCERRFEVGLAVEHICPKISNKELEKKWSNFLIACTQCNSAKGNTEIKPEQKSLYVWPDEDDTYHMIVYPAQSAYQAKPAIGLSDNERERVINTINLVNINRTTNEYNRTTYKDKLIKRQEVAKESIRQRNSYMIAKFLVDNASDPISQQLAIENYQNIKTTILNSVSEYGCWSIWMKEFEDIPEIKNCLLNLSGTNRTYF